MVKVLLPLTVIVANATNLALVAIVSVLLPASEFSSFSILWALGQLISTGGYDWLRLAAVRHSADPEQGTAISSLYFVAVACCVLAGAALIATGELRWLGSSLLFAACLSAFEGRQAFLRARFDNGRFVSSAIIRTLASVLATTAGAYLSRDATITLSCLALSFLLGLVPAGPRQFNLPRLGAVTASSVLKLVRYGAPLSVAGILSAGTMTLVRTAVVSAAGPHAAAGFLLAFDLVQKVLNAIGAAANLILLQNSIRAISEGEQHVRDAIGRHIVTVFALLLPATVGICLISSAAVWALPTGYVVEPRSVVLLTVALGLASFRGFSIDAVFAVTGHAWLAMPGPILGAAIALGAPSLLGPMSSVAASDYAVSLLLGMLAALVMNTILSRASIRWSISLRDWVRVIGAAVFMTAAVAWINAASGVASLLLAIAVGVLAFTVAVVALNPLDLRASIRQFRGK